MKGGLESGDKLAAKDTAEHFDGQEEGAARGDPAGVIRSEAAGGQHAVNMGMMLQSLVPGVEHAEEADLGSKVPGIASDLQQSCGAGVEQQVVDQPFVLQCQRSQFTRQGEDDMDVAGGQQLPFAAPAASAGGRCPGIVDNAGCDTSCRRWQYVRNLSTDRDVHRAQRCGIV